MTVVRRRHGNTPADTDLVFVLEDAHANHITGRTLSSAVVARRIGAGVTAATVDTVLGASAFVDGSSGPWTLNDAGIAQAKAHPAPRGWQPNQ